MGIWTRRSGSHFNLVHIGYHYGPYTIGALSIVSRRAGASDHLTVSIRLYETLSHVNSELSHLGGFLSVLEDAERVVPDYEKIPTAAAQFGSVCGSFNATTPTRGTQGKGWGADSRTAVGGTACDLSSRSYDSRLVGGLLLLMRI